MIGTIMAGNVFFNIIPAHWELINAKRAGRDPDPTPGIVAKQRSVHNNYFTLPVLFTMLAGHFAFTYGAGQRLARAPRDHVRSASSRGSSSTCATRAARSGRFPRSASSSSSCSRSRSARTTEGAATARRRSPSRRSRRWSRSAARPATHRHRPQPGFSSPPAGVVLETPEQIAARADDIKTRRLVEGDAARQPHRHDERRARPRRRLGHPGRVDRKVG